MTPECILVLLKKILVERIEIKWPSGKLQILENIKANQILTVQNLKINFDE